MANDDLKEFERRVAADREALAQTLDVLGDSVAPDRLKAEAGQAAKAYGTDVSQHLFGAARENPAAFALVGAGLALLLSGTGHRQEHSSGSPSQPEPSPEVPNKEPAETRGSPRSEPKASRLRAGIDQGLDKLPAQARARVRRARAAAIRAQEAVEARATRLGNQAERAVRDQPVTVAASAFGLGALIAAVLPATRREDEALGARRDALMNAARAALSEELEALCAGPDPLTETGSPDAPAPTDQATGAGFQVPS